MSILAASPQKRRPDAMAGNTPPRKRTQALKTDSPSTPPVAFEKPKRSPLWFFIWAVLAIGLIGNISIVAYLFLGMVWR